MHLAELCEGMPGLMPASGKMLGESAAICLESRNHHSGVKLALAGLSSNIILLEWSTVDDQQRRCYWDMQEATERGACGVAILVVREVTGEVVVERSKKGTGFDYWLGDKDDDLLFVGKTRLEVSGILSGTTGEISSRIKKKKEQMKPSEHLAVGYVAVIEFGTPIAQLETA